MKLYLESEWIGEIEVTYTKTVEANYYPDGGRHFSEEVNIDTVTCQGVNVWDLVDIDNLVEYILEND